MRRHSPGEAADPWTLEAVTTQGGAISAVATAPGGGAFVGIGAYVLHLVPEGSRLSVAARSAQLPGTVQSLELVDATLYATAGSAGLWIFEVNQEAPGPDRPASIELIGTLRTSRPADHSLHRDGLLYLAEPGGLRVVDVSDPTAPVEVGFTALPEEVSEPLVGPGLAVIAFVRDWMVGLARGTAIVFDVMNPREPVVAASEPVRGVHMAVWADQVFVASRDGIASFEVIPGGELWGTGGVDLARLGFEPRFMVGRDNVVYTLASRTDGTGSVVLRIDPGTLRIQGQQPLDNGFARFAVAQRSLFAWNSYSIALLPGQDGLDCRIALEVPGPVDVLASANGCSVGVAFGGLWRIGSWAGPMDAPEPLNGPAHNTVKALSSSGRHLIAGRRCYGGDCSTGSLDVLSCTEGGVLRTVATLPADSEAGWHSADLAVQGTRAYVVDVWPGTVYHSAEQRLKLVDLSTPHEPKVVGQTKLLLKTADAPHIAARRQFAVASVDDVLLTVRTDQTGNPEVVDQLKIEPRQYGPIPVAMTAVTSDAPGSPDAFAYVAVSHEIRRIAIDISGRAAYTETVRLPGRVAALAGNGSRVAAVVYLDDPASQGHEGAVYWLTTDSGQPFAADHIAHIPLETWDASAQLRGGTLSVAAGNVGVVWLHFALPETVHLPWVGTSLRARSASQLTSPVRSQAPTVM